MSPRYRLLGARERGPGAARDVVALGAGGERSVAQLQDDAAQLARGLPAAAADAEALIACNDRYAFGVALLASWARGYRAALPPSHHAQALRELSARVAVVLHDGDAEPSAHAHDVREALAAPRSAAGEPIAAIGELDADARAVTLYTSGTTGAPEAVLKSAAQLLGEVEVLSECFGAELSRVLCTLPARHIYGLLFGLLLPLRAGAAFVRETPLHTDAALALVDRHRIDTLVAVPAHLQGLTAVERSALGPLRKVFTSGAPLGPGPFDELTGRLGLSVSEVFGSTETGGIAHRSGAGQPYAPFAGVSVAAAEDGRMLLTSPRLPGDAEQPRLCEDVIELVAGGRFAHLGRADDVVKIGGSRVSLSEIERVVRGLPNVADVAVVARAVPSARGHEILLAVAGQGWDGPGMRAALLARLPAIAVPRRYRFVAELPREATGKLRRDNVLAMFTQSSSRPTELERLSIERSDTKARVELRVPSDLLFFQGHFEGWPVLPGVAQLGLAAVRQVEQVWPALGPLRRVRRLKMKQPIAPGDVLVLELTRTLHATPSAADEQRIDFTLTRDGAICTTGTLTFARNRGR